MYFISGGYNINIDSFRYVMGKTYGFIDNELYSRVSDSHTAEPLLPPNQNALAENLSKGIFLK